MSNNEKKKSANFKRNKIIDRYPGEKEQLISHLQEKLGKSKKEIKEILNKL